MRIKKEQGLPLLWTKQRLLFRHDWKRLSLVLLWPSKMKHLNPFFRWGEYRYGIAFQCGEVAYLIINFLLCLLIVWPPSSELPLPKNLKKPYEVS